MARQIDKVLSYLQAHGEMTTREAVLELNVMSLPRRIMELREAGHDISTVYRVSSAGTKYGVYVLNE